MRTSITIFIVVCVLCSVYAIGLCGFKLKTYELCVPFLQKILFCECNRISSQIGRALHNITTKPEMIFNFYSNYGCEYSNNRILLFCKGINNQNEIHRHKQCTQYTPMWTGFAKREEKSKSLAQDERDESTTYIQKMNA